MTTGEDDPKFSILTSLLHWKANSATITEADLNKIYKEICGTNGASAASAKPVMDIIKDEAKSSRQSASDSFESKIVLSIAIRLAAESFMATKINDAVFMGAIKAHQTQELLAKFKSQFAAETKAIEVLDRVQLMTPENIHLNSFMYEPIVDMSGDHLRQLYDDVTAL